jgi:C1A family cysteine protease
MNYGHGCKPSKMDGTEHKYEYSKTQLPETFSYVSVMPPITDQGSTSKCVCHALTAFLDWNKNQFENDNNGGQFDIDTLYAIRSDKSSEGMQIKEALSFLRHKGLNGAKIKEYALVGSDIALQQALVMNGPCPLALPVKSENEKFWKGNHLYGGHCVLAVGYNKNGFIMRNSWGESYGENGYFLFPYKDFNDILEIWTIL